MVTYICNRLVTQFMRRDVFQAIADPTRREIINLVAQSPLNLNAVADNFNISRPAISKHVKILTECGLIIITQTGRERQCRANLQQLSEVQDWVNKYSAFWDNKLSALQRYLETDNQKKKRRSK